MNTFTYNSAGLSVKDRLTITNLLGLFEGRLNAKWVSVTPAQNRAAQLELIDVDRPEGLQSWEEQVKGRVAVTANDRWPGEPFISRPIRAYGPNGVIVLFNSIAQTLASSPEPQREPARIRMTGRLEAPTAVPASAHAPRPAAATSTQTAVTGAPRVTRAPWSVNARPLTIPKIPAVHPQTPEAEAPSVRPRVALRWGPPELVVLPPLTRMPGARIHRFGVSSSAESTVEIQLPTPSINDLASPVTEVPVTHPLLQNQPRSWTAPKAAEPAPLAEMPIVHRPVEIHAPSAPVIGRARFETFASPAPIVQDTPVLRPAPPQWKSPEPQPVKQLVDFRTWQDAPIVAPIERAPLVEVVTVENAAEAVVVEPESFEQASETEVATKTVAEAPAIEAKIIERQIVEPQIVEENVDAPGPEQPVAIVRQSADEDEIEALFTDVQQNLETLSHAITGESYPEDLPELDAEADWWGAADDADATSAAQDNPPENSSLLSVLRAIKTSGQPSILEIAGLPAVCVIPARNIYFTTAPSARFETAIGAASNVTCRVCSSEAEARELSGTEQSRQASLEQLSWAAALMTPPADVENLADRAVRLRRWPPITESRGRSKFLRYATILSGAQATPRELADITGDSVEEIVAFVNACSQMNLLETSGSAPAAVAVPPARNGGAGILRDMIEQLTPPKI